MKVIGVDVGGTKCAVTAGYTEGNKLTICDKKGFATDTSKSADEMMAQLFEITEEFIKTYGAEVIGISCGGPLDSKTGTIICPPNLPNLHHFNITKAFSNRFGLPCHLQNDANACALAEWLYGAGERCENMVFLTFGTGLGAGLILDGKLYEGTNGNAGVVGNIRLSENGPVGFGKAGSFEGFCSGGGIAQLGYTMGLAAYQRGERPLYFDPKTAPGSITAKSIAIAAEQHGDKTAIEVYRRCGEYLGKGLSIIVDLLNPQKIVIGSIFQRSRNGIWPACAEIMQQEALDISLGCCEVVAAQLIENIGDYAALTVGVYGHGLKGE